MTAATATRNAPILVGDGLRRIAMRELGDALRWIELAEVNQLRPPYIIDSIDPADRQRATLIYGDLIRIPLGKVTDSVQLPQDVLGTDCALPHGQLQPNATGDWALVAANNNLSQALCHRVKTPVGDLLAHPEYGSQVTLVLGLKNINVIQLMAIGFVRQALKQDPRVAEVPGVQSAAPGDQLQITAQIQAVVRNAALDLNLVFPFER
jgi:phage baseplate assembly protein W